MDIRTLMRPVPDYSAFLTVAEMDESTRHLAAEFPDLVRVEVAGHSRNGHAILKTTIGSGRRNALLFGCPHPNEPIGAMTLEYLTRELCENRVLREALDYTFTIIKVIDPDGTRLNEGWFKGPFTVERYLRGYYRPSFPEQVAWTFPVDYGRIHFGPDKSIPETKILMDLIDRLKPDFMYSMHNLGFGGAYWYLSGPAPELYEKYYESAQRNGIPRKLGEAEVPYAHEFAPAVFRLLKVSDKYDYTCKYSGEAEAAKQNYGTVSGEYAEKYGTFTFINELPYFFERRVSDLSDSGLTRRAIILESCALKRAHYLKSKALYDEIAPLTSLADNHFKTALHERMRAGLSEVDAQAEWAKRNPAFEQNASVAQMFDNLYVARFFRATTTSLLMRACEAELQRAAARGLSSGKIAALERARDQSSEHLKAECEYLEENLDYRVTPIGRLVSVQAECGLMTAQYIAERQNILKRGESK